MDNKELINEGLEKSLCKPWAEQMQNATTDELLAMYVKGIDFCLSNDYPPKEYLKEHGKGLLSKHGIYIDELLKVENKEKIILLGNCDASIEITGYMVTEIFIKHESRAVVNVKHKAFVVIDLFEQSDLILNASGECTVLLNVYESPTFKVNNAGSANVKVVHKNQKTY